MKLWEKKISVIQASVPNAYEIPAQCSHSRLTAQPSRPMALATAAYKRPTTEKLTSLLSVYLCLAMQNTSDVTLRVNELVNVQCRAMALGFIENRQCFSQAITRPLFLHSEPRSTSELLNRGFHFKELEQSR